MTAKTTVDQSANVETMYRDKGYYEGFTSRVAMKFVVFAQRVMASPATSVMKSVDSGIHRCCLGACFPIDMHVSVGILLLFSGVAETLTDRSHPGRRNLAGQGQRLLLPMLELTGRRIFYQQSFVDWIVARLVTIRRTQTYCLTW
jgi:hypothetical protein